MTSDSKSVVREGSHCVVIVAHPDDEVLWVGGFILMHPDVNWTVVSLCRKNDPDRMPRFFKAMKEFGSVGIIGDIDDGPDQRPLKSLDIQKSIIELLPFNRFDLIITHGLAGEYTKHLRHEEVSRAVFALCKSERLISKYVWTFAYEDGKGQYLPRADSQADSLIYLTDEIWQKKYDIITKIYNFGEDSFEAKVTPRCEAFWHFKM